MAYAKPKIQLSTAEEREQKILEHLRKPTTKPPRNKKGLIRSLIAHLGHKITEAEALELVDMLGQAGHLVIDEKGKVNYHLQPG